MVLNVVIRTFWNRKANASLMEKEVITYDWVKSKRNKCNIKVICLRNQIFLKDFQVSKSICFSNGNHNHFNHPLRGFSLVDASFIPKSCRRQIGFVLPPIAFRNCGIWSLEQYKGNCSWTYLADMLLFFLS